MDDKKPLKEYFIFQPLLLASMVILGIVLGKKIEDSSTPISPAKSRSVTTRETSNSAVEEASRFIQARFIDSVNLSRLNDMAIKNMVKELDPYSTYLVPDQITQIQYKSFKDAYGFNVTMINNQWIVDEIVPGTAAWNSQLEIGDQLINVNDSAVSPASFTKWNDTLLKINCRSVSQYRNYEFLRRDQAGSTSVSDVFTLSANTGYIRINRFGDTVYDEFITAIDSLYTSKSIKNFVLDLRDNAGGYIEECIRVLNQFFKEKNILLAYTEGRTVRKIEYKTDGRQLFNLGKLAVLINDGSASASEVFAGAIQDLDRGKIIGGHSYGKGLVQEQYMLSNGAALRLSVSRFYLPSGRSVDKNGKESPESFKYYNVNKKLLHAGKYIYPDIYASPLSGAASDEVIKSAVVNYKIKHNNQGKDPVNSIYNSILSTRKKWSAAEKKELLAGIKFTWGTTLKDTKSVLQYQILIQPEIKAALKALN